MTSITILGTHVHVGRFEDTIEILVKWAETTKESRFISTCTVYTLMRAYDDAAIAHVLQEADLVVADGMPLVWLQHWYGHKSAERIYGPDIMLSLCQEKYNRTIKHYFYGGSPHVTNMLIHSLRQRNANICISGYYYPPIVAEEDLSLDPTIVNLLNASEANVIWVGLGSPKQDLWMQIYQPHLKGKLLIGVGAAFDFISGNKAQAPEWMRHAGLEWLFRLLSEPRRLWKRYIIYNVRFLMALFHQPRKKTPEKVNRRR